ncbi:MAG: hypothetical protein AAF561_04920 [Planctomycetota bacterium]
MRQVLVVGLVVLCGFAGGCGVRVLEPEVRLQRVASLMDQPLAAAAFSDDGRFVALLSRRGNVAVWDAETGDLLAEATVPPTRHNSFGMNGPLDFGDDHRLALATPDGGVLIWSWKDGTEEVVDLALPGPADHIALGRDGQLAAAFGGFKYELNEREQPMLVGFDPYVIAGRTADGQPTPPVVDREAGRVVLLPGAALVRRYTVGGHPISELFTLERERSEALVRQTKSESAALINLASGHTRWDIELPEGFMGTTIFSDDQRTALLHIRGKEDEPRLLTLLVHDGRIIDDSDGLQFGTTRLTRSRELVAVGWTSRRASLLELFATMKHEVVRREGGKTRSTLFLLGDFPRASPLAISPDGRRLLATGPDLYELP